MQRLILSLIAAASFAFAISGGAQFSPLEKTRIRVGVSDATVELARTPLEQEMGLMMRKSLGKDEGMLFIYDSPLVLTFWMKNTLIPLDIGYFDTEGRLMNVLPMQPAPEGTSDAARRRYPSEGPARYALEMERGWFAKNKIKKGATLKILGEKAAPAAKHK